MKTPQSCVARQLPHGGTDLARWLGDRGVRESGRVIEMVGRADGSLRWSGEFHAYLGRFAITCVAPADRACGEGARGGGGGSPEVWRPASMNQGGHRRHRGHLEGHRRHRVISAVIEGTGVISEVVEGTGASRRSSKAPGRSALHESTTTGGGLSRGGHDPADLASAVREPCELGGGTPTY